MALSEPAVGGHTTVVLVSRVFGLTGLSRFIPASAACQRPSCSGPLARSGHLIGPSAGLGFPCSDRAASYEEGWPTRYSQSLFSSYSIYWYYWDN